MSTVPATLSPVRRRRLIMLPATLGLSYLLTLIAGIGLPLALSNVTLDLHNLLMGAFVGCAATSLYLLRECLLERAPPTSQRAEFWMLAGLIPLVGQSLGWMIMLDSLSSPETRTGLIILAVLGAAYLLPIVVHMYFFLRLRRATSAL